MPGQRRSSSRTTVAASSSGRSRRSTRSPTSSRAPRGVEVYLDGGVRRGGDILIALALGARAVMIGRPAMWGLAVGGAEGVARVLDGVPRSELADDAGLCGLADVTAASARPRRRRDRLTRRCGSRRSGASSSRRPGRAIRSGSRARSSSVLRPSSSSRPTRGSVGVGETIMGYFLPDSVPPLVDYYGNLLVELGLDPSQPEACFRELYQRSLWWGRVGLGLSVLSGIEMALWDIAGKAAGRPVHELIGGPAHDRLPLYASGGTGAWPLERTVDQARRYASLGFRGLKIGTGLRGPAGRVHDGPGNAAVRHVVRRQHGRRGSPTSAAKFGALREALGPDIELATDCHAVQVREPWSRRTALDLARALEPFDLLFMEEPLRYDDPAGLRRAAAALTRVPIAGGECLTGHRRVRPLPRCRRLRLRPARRDARRGHRRHARRRPAGRGAPRRADRPHRRRGRPRVHGQSPRGVREPERAVRRVRPRPGQHPPKRS